jgi:phosphomevalonate kinase
VPLGVKILARAPGKLVVLGEYAVLDGAPALVLAVDRLAEAEVQPSSELDCRLEISMPDADVRRFAGGAPSGVPLVDLVTTGSVGAPVWQGRLDTSAFFAGKTKLGLGSSAAALCAWAGAWGAYCRRHRLPGPATDLETLVGLHRRFQGGRGSGLDVAASLTGGLIVYRLGPAGAPRIGSVRLPNSVGFAGIFAGRSASTPELVAHYRAWRTAHPDRAAAQFETLRTIAEAGSLAAQRGEAEAFVEAIADYGRGLHNLGTAIGADIVTVEHRQIGEDALRHGVAYKVSGAGGGDLGLACAADHEALEAFKRTVSRRGFRVVDFEPALGGLTVEERVEERME